MTDLLFDDLSQSTQVQEYSVSQISEILKMTLEETFSYIRIRGEISGLKIHRSGHIYFNLKDEKSVINVVCWRGTAASLPFKPEEGLEVICTGKISIYAGRSNYQLIISKIEVAGVGALLALLEKRKKKLEEEGVFDADKKQKIPYIPNVIGVITSPTGAVIRDILHRIENRYPTRIILWGVPVQGQGASDKVVEAIKGFNLVSDDFPRPDLLIVARGGGSIEDLMPFNEENVVRAVAASTIPVISAIGHETDTTLIDYVADLRAPTPTAAAELAVPVKKDLEYTINKYAERLNISLPNLLSLNKARIERASYSLVKFFTKLENLYNGVNNSWLMLKKNFEVLLMNKSGEISMFSKLLESFHYKKVLKRGFAIVRADGAIIKSSKNFPDKKSLDVEFYDGEICIDRSSPKAKQGSLFD